ncbi:DUF7151 family protein [Aquimarina sp. 433]
MICLNSCSDGEDGISGQNGLNSLIETIGEPAGINCENGGIKIESGLDTNANGSLETNEIISTEYICNVERQYQIYAALLTQSDENDPIETSLLNELNISIDWIRLDQGEYQGTLSEPISEDTTLIFQVKDENILSTSEFFDSMTILLHNRVRTNLYQPVDGFENAVLEIKKYN